jgi:ABC-type phosphate transport system substrate-binding protein
MQRNIFLFVLISLLIIGSEAFAGADDILFIVNKSVQAQINKNTIKKIYLGRKSRWNNHEKIVFYTFDSSELIEKFTKNFLGKSKHQFENYWKRQLFTGKGRLPRAIKTLDESFNIISQTKGSIMFIPAPDQEINHDNIRIISIQ